MKNILDEFVNLTTKQSLEILKRSFKKDKNDLRDKLKTDGLFITASYFDDNNIETKIERIKISAGQGVEFTRNDKGLVRFTIIEKN